MSLRAGAPTDISAEPLTWLAYADYIPWVDGAGCPVRIDVISDVMGPEHCGWEASERITIGTPLGASIRNDAGTDGGTARTFIFDPHGVVGAHPPHVSMAVADLPASALDTGYRAADAQLWLDPSDAEHLYRVRNGLADRFVLDTSDQLCA